jgi:hypothetical protein
MFYLNIIAQIRFYEDHLAAHIPGHFLGLLTAGPVNVQPDRHEFIGGCRHCGGSADAAGGPRDDTNVIGIEHAVRKHQYVVMGYGGFLDVHFLSLRNPKRWICARKVRISLLNSEIYANILYFVKTI